MASYIDMHVIKNIYKGTTRIKRVYKNYHQGFQATESLTLTLSTGIDKIYYKINGASDWSYLTSSNTLTVEAGSTVYLYATASTGYNLDSPYSSYTSSNPYSFSVSTSTTWAPTATIANVTLTITFDTTKISFVRYKIQGASSSSYVYSPTNLTFLAGTVIFIQTYGSNTQHWAVDSPYNIEQTITLNSNYTYAPTTTTQYYTISVPAKTNDTQDDGAMAHYLSTDPNALSGSTSLTVEYGTVVYRFGKLTGTNTEVPSTRFTKQYINSNWVVIYDPSETPTAIYYQYNTIFRLGEFNVTQNYTLGDLYWKTLKAPEISLAQAYDYDGIFVKNTNMNTAPACSVYIYAETSTGSDIFDDNFTNNALGYNVAWCAYEGLEMEEYYVSASAYLLATTDYNESETTYFENYR